jgi:hypothetical protein
MYAIQIEEMMILNFVKYISEIEIGRLTSKYHIVNIFIKFVIVWCASPFTSRRS